MRFNVNILHILQVGTRNRNFYNEMNGVKLENLLCVKYFGIIVGSNFKVFQQCKDAAGKDLGFMSFMNTTFTFKNTYG